MIKKIDYNRNPIQIYDYNYIFNIWVNILLIPLVIYLLVLNPFSGNKNTIDNYYIYIILPAMLYPFLMPYFKTRKDRRKIIMNENEIIFVQGENIIKNIRVKDIVKIRKTYTDLYHKSQQNNIILLIVVYIFIGLYLYFLGINYLIFGITIIISYQILILISKLIFHIYQDGFSSYRFNDAIFIEDISGEFINILPTTSNEYEQIQKYFLQVRNEDIVNKNVYFTFGHIHENINT